MTPPNTPTSCSTRRTPGGRHQHRGYRNAEVVTDLLDRFQLSTDPAQRGELLGQALVASAADVPYQPLWWGSAATAFGPGVQTDAYGPYFFIGPWATQLDVSA
ncbi:MAG: hypothetical protein R2697_00630 [Ilumatobacteraceae bacterium]